MALTETNSGGIKDGTIVNADVNASAAIAVSKISGAMPTAGGTFTGDVTWDNGTNAGKDMIWDESDDTLKFNDDVQISLGSDRDVRLYHTGSHAYVNVVTGDLNIRTNSTESAIVCTANAGVATYYDSAKKTETTATGLAITGGITTTTASTFVGDVTFDNGTNAGKDITWDESEDHLVFADDTYAKFGAGGDLQLYHNGTDSLIHNTNGTLKITSSAGNNIRIRSDNMRLQSITDDENYLTAVKDGAVELYYDNSKKAETTSAGITVTGSITDDKGDVRKIIQNSKSASYTLIASDSGKHILTDSNVTVPDSVFAAGDAVTIINNSGSNITITKGTNMYNAADATNANRTLAGRGMATLLFTAADTCYISGAGLT